MTLSHDVLIGCACQSASRGTSLRKTSTRFCPFSQVTVGSSPASIGQFIVPATVEATPIPTLPEVALLVFVLLFGALGGFVVWKRAA